MFDKQLKESFVSNLNGTSILEVTVGLCLPNLLMLLRGLVFVLHYQKYGLQFYSWKAHLFLDVIILILPLIACFTVLSDFLYLATIVTTATCGLLLCLIYSGRTTYMKLPFKRIYKNFLVEQVVNDTVPAVTALRALLNVFTAVCILAVDFPIFPRRYAKAETYGTGLMDIGVGSFVFANALVSPEAKGRGGKLHSKLSVVVKQLFSVWPIFLLGLVRLVSVKSVDYHEHVSEYGVHWNFFFTLAVVRVLSSLLLTILPTHKAWIVATVFVSGYQVLLETTPLKSFILYGSDGTGTRLGFLNANREGIVSLIAYTGIYMAGVQAGLYVLKKRMFIKDWISDTWKLMSVGFLLFLIFLFVGIFLEPVSRRLANLTFCLWIISLGIIFLSFILLINLVLVSAKYLVPGSKVLCTWDICKSPGSCMKQDISQKGGKKEVLFCLIEAINRNQLFFFLLSNVMTGLVNMLIDTIHSSTILSLCVLILYMYINCLIIYILHISDISVKWW
ncbi:phosphatidylinositol-glycan biosynthesis class W protein [Discoglossus pictus]